MLPSLALSTLVVYGLGLKLGIVIPHRLTAVCLVGAAPFAVTVLTTYEEYKKLLDSTYALFNRALGLSRYSLLVHGSRSVATALTANLTNVFLYLFTATVFVEIVLMKPGVGNLLLNAALYLDYPVMVSVSLLVVILFSLMNVLSRLVLYAADPRTR